VRERARKRPIAKYVARMGENRNADRIFVGKPEGKRLLGRRRRGWDEGIKIGIREIGCGGMDWIHP
jgi:hypothetical protein